jgi:thioredoxin reductase (NADPH)
MAGPVILAVDDDADLLGSVERELRKRYGVDYEVVCAASPFGGIARLGAGQGPGWAGRPSSSTTRW